MKFLKRIGYLVLGVVIIAAVILAYPVIGFYFPSSTPIPTADKTNNPLGEFCADGQKFITSTSIAPDNHLYDTFENFVLSKAGLDDTTLRTSQYILYDKTSEGEKYAKLISCKFKSSDRIKGVRGEDAAGEERTCKGLNQRTVDKVLTRLNLDSPPAITFEDDEVEDMGQLWLDPWPYPAVSQGDDGALRIRAGAVLTPYTWYHIMPERFLGVHYCHLVAPDYVEALLTGKIVATKGGGT